jgi:hypothetical protein
MLAAGDARAWPAETAVGNGILNGESVKLNSQKSETEIQPHTIQLVQSCYVHHLAPRYARVAVHDLTQFNHVE